MLLKELITNVETRIKTLRQEFGVSTGTDCVELSEFRRRSGFSKLFYYLWNKRRIDAAGELEGLQRVLHEAQLNSTKEHNDLLQVFGDGAPSTPMLKRHMPNCTICPAEIDQLKKTLAAPGLAEKYQAERIFWAQMREKHFQSKQPTDRILARYISNHPDLKLKSNPINLKTPQETASAPSYLEHLPDKGTAQDIIDAAKKYNVSSENLAPAKRESSFIETPSGNISVQEHTTLFWIIPCNFLSSIDRSIKEQLKSMESAKTELLTECTTLSNQYIEPFVKFLINEVENCKRGPEQKQVHSPVTEKQTSSPSPVPAQPSMLDWALTMLPSFNSSITPAPAPEAPSVAPGKSWYQIW